MSAETDNLFMGLAIELAHTAYENNEVPVGAVVVQKRNAEILAAFSNQMRSTGSSLAHAEMLALQKSMELIKNERLVGCDMYVSLEPCPMCAGAAWASRIGKVVYGAPSMDAGALGSLLNVGADPRLNYEFPVVGGLLAEESADLLAKFFSRHR